MKNLLVIAFGLFGTIAEAKIIPFDTIYVSKESTVYVILPETISLFDIGNKDYVGKIENGKIIFLKATTSFAKPTSMLIQYGDNLFKGFVAFREKVDKPFYDFSTSLKQNVENPKNVNTPIVAEKFTKLDQLREVAANENVTEEVGGIEVKLTNLFNDQKATYLRFEVKNNSTIVYHVDYVSFSYKTKVKRKKRNQLSPQQEELEPLQFDAPSVLNSGDTETFLYAIPLYSASDNSFLEIVFRESKGSRFIPIKLSAKKILKANLL